MRKRRAERAALGGRGEGWSAGDPGQPAGPGRVVPGERVPEGGTHVVGVEALAYAGRHVEAALERIEPHHVRDVVAEKP